MSDSFLYCGEGTYIAKNALLGKNAFLESDCQIGHPSPVEFEKIVRTSKGHIDVHDLYDNNKLVKIGDNAIIRSGTIIYSGTTIGDRFDCAHTVHIREDCNIGHDVYLMKHACIGKKVVIGNNVRIMGRVTDGCIIEDNVISLGFLADDKYCGSAGSGIKKPPIIHRRAIIGANAVVMEGVEVGEYAFVGAGSVVTKHVEPYSVVVGSPAKRIKDVRDLPFWSDNVRTRCLLSEENKDEDNT